MELRCWLQDADGKSVDFVMVPRGADGRLPRAVSFEGRVYAEHRSMLPEDEKVYREVEPVKVHRRMSEAAQEYLRQASVVRQMRADAQAQMLRADEMAEAAKPIWESLSQPDRDEVVRRMTELL